MMKNSAEKPASPPITTGQTWPFATGDWPHLFGPGRAETLCRVAIDLKQSKLVAAQEWTGLKYVDIQGERLKNLAESVIGANDAHDSPSDWGLTLTQALPDWVKPSNEPGQQITKVTQYIQRDDGSEVRIVAQVFGAILASQPSIGVHVHRRAGPDQDWVLCSDQPHPDWRSMSVSDYAKHGRSELLRTVSTGELLRAFSLLGAPMPAGEEAAEVSAKAGPTQSAPRRNRMS
ncbi:hypothetical protein [Acidovorax carolinensis]|uniref:hypothetical protein n=1 Tax=Acidovorax carolinensis TaxID=553814 RepID=UPI001F45814F|nr:hypothetical protein [Acidovorax carolinensis]